MDIDLIRAEVAALRAAATQVGLRLLESGSRLGADDLFEIAGDLQKVLNAVDGAQLVAVAHAAAHEQRLTERGIEERHHAPGFVDAMASSEVSLATGIGGWAAGRLVGLASSAVRFPRTLGRVVAGEVPSRLLAKVAATCDGLDAQACESVDSVLADTLADLDPARVVGVTRRVATRVAPEQVREQQRRHRRDRCVEVSPGPDGTTTWWAQLPADRSAAAWAAVRDLGDRYADSDPTTTLDQARADAFLDLLLTNVSVAAKVTIGIPVIRVDEPSQLAPDDDGSAQGHHVAAAVGGQGLGERFSIRAALDGCDMPGLGWIDADTVERLLQTVPLEVGRALLDARTGALVETTSSAYRPPKDVRGFVANRDGTCRMWGCSRPALACDVDHARPWPSGPTSPRNLAGLCRRHHRLKQRRRWQYRLHPDGTVTWTSPSGATRTTRPEHTLWPPSDERRTAPPPVPQPEPAGVVAAPPF